MEPTEEAILIKNQHVPPCGSLPVWARERLRDAYFGYFENEYGEQWVFLATEELAQLAGGEMGWEHVYRIERPDLHCVEDWLVMQLDLDANELCVPWPGIVLGRAESDWLEAAVRAAGERSRFTAWARGSEASSRTTRPGTSRGTPGPCSIEAQWLALPSVSFRPSDPAAPPAHVRPASITGPEVRSTAW